MLSVTFDQTRSFCKKLCLSLQLVCVVSTLCTNLAFGQDYGQHEIHPSLKATEELNQVHRVFTYTRQSPLRPDIKSEKLSSPLTAPFSKLSSSLSSSASSSSSSSFPTSSFSLHSHQDGQDNISKLREFRKQHQPIEREESSFASFITGDDRFITQSPNGGGLWFRSISGGSTPSPTRPPSSLGLPSHLECPVCYELVEQQVLDLRAHLNRLVAQLEEIQRRPEVVEDIGFQLRLRELASAVDALLRDAQFARSEEQAILQQLTELRQRVKKVTAIRDSITQLPEIERWIQLAQSNATNVHALLARVAGGVADARAFLDKQAGGALIQAWERSRQYGQQSQRLSEIARESRLLAEEHGTDGMEIFRLATVSLNTSQTAYRLAKDAISTQEGNKLSMEKLRRQMKSTEELLVKTVKIAEDAQKESLRTYNDALDIYSKSTPSVPALRADKVNQDAAWVISQSVKIINEVERLLSKYELSADGGNRKLEEAKLLLQQAQQLQAETDRLLAETQRNLARAQAAIESGELTLKEAQNTLNTLKEFDQLVGKSKAKAEEALRKVEEIHNLVKEAELKTEQAEKALKGALQDAQEARDIALEAHRIAERASMQVRKLKEAALGVKSKASEMKKRLDLFNVKIEESNTKIVQCEGDGQQDSRMVKDTLEKANQAKNSAADALKKIQSAINTLDSILEELESLDQVDGSLLEELFQRLAKAEQEYKDADLDNRAAHLTDARDQQRKWIIDYERLIAKLMADVNNVDKIRLALPDKCFRRIRLEP